VESWFDSRQGKEFVFVSSPKAAPGLGSTQTLIEGTLGYVSPGMKFPGREVDNSRHPIIIIYLFILSPGLLSIPDPAHG
jgi:hypothetical protein